MWLQLTCVLPLILVSSGIKVPVDRSDEADADEAPAKEDPTANIPIYYLFDDRNTDSYLIPPNPHQPEDVLPDTIVTPATFLLPPAADNQKDYYYNPTEPAEQTDWYPIAEAAPAKPAQLQDIPIYQNLNQSDNFPHLEHKRRAKSHDRNVVQVPATGLEPPLVDAPNDYFVPTTSEWHSLQEEKIPINVPKIDKYNLPLGIPKELAINYRTKSIEPTLASHLTPPQPQFANRKIPTKLYPKKFGGEFKPVPIPIAQYADESALEIPRAKPAKLFKPLPATEIDYLTPTDEKINYLYRKAEHKQKLKGEEVSQEQQRDVSAVDPYPHTRFSEPNSTEQEASETHYRNPGRNTYPAPLRQAPPAAPQRDASSPAPDERTEFRMHGMKGPHSYQFGFDTGKGKNRQFRYEERDNEGLVKGHYGYMDKRGKLRVVNYSADPKTGFKAEEPVEKE